MSAPLLCVTVAAARTAELRQRRDAVAGADLVELRLDSVADPDVGAALEGRRTPVIITCRPVWEGGGFRGSERERKAILREALDRGAEYVDIEFRSGFTDLIRSTNGRRIVLSTHDFDGVPADLADRVRAMRAERPEILKVAILARSLSECLVLRALHRDSSDGRAALIAMGPAGLATRILPSRFGSCWTYAGERHAPGQIPVPRLLEEFHFRRISVATDVYGVVGSPLTHTVSPAMHNAAFRWAGVDAVYLPLVASSADDFLMFAEALQIKGASVTIPFKRDLFTRVDEVDPLSQRVGAINTLRREAGRWVARNTDVSGFLAPLAGRIDLRGARAAILGAGGAARAVAVGLASAGASVVVYARNRAAGEQVAALAEGRAAAGSPPSGTWDLLVNTTPVGMSPHIDETPWEHAVFDGRLVYDLIYNPAQTRLLRDAAAAGCDTIGGLDMLVAQAEEQSEWWTGHRPPRGLMRDAALAQLAQPLEMTVG